MTTPTANNGDNEQDQFMDSPALQLHSSKEETLLRAAQAVFEAKGLAGTTVEEICELAGISRPTFYKRYKDKDRIFVAYVMYKARAIMDYIETLPQEVTDRESFLETTRLFAQFTYRKDVMAFHAMVAGEARFNEEVRLLYSNVMIKRHAQQRQLVVMRLIITGLVPPTRDIAKLTALMGALITTDIYFPMLTGGLPRPTPEQLDKDVRARTEMFLEVAQHLMG